MFGSSLSIICEREKTKIPRFVHACLAAVEKRGKRFLNYLKKLFLFTVRISDCYIFPK